MKKYNFKTAERREADNKIVRFKEEMDALISSEEFIEKFRGYIEDLARYKTVKGIKYRRSTEYAAIGIMDMNDVYQEAYLAFFEAYENYKSKAENFDTGAEIWSYLKKSTILNFEAALRGKKDGIRLTHHAQFVSKTHSVNVLTSLFARMEVAFTNNIEEVAMTRYETDLTGAFLEVHMDDFLDKYPNGTRYLKGIERKIVKDFYGIDTERKSSREIADELQKGVGTIDVVRKRALDKLREEDPKRILANFLHEYRINTKADAEKYRK